MATPTLVLPSAPVPPGSTGEVDVTFQLAPATPDKVATVTLTSDGSVVGSGAVTLKGTPAETMPTVTIGSTGVGWELQTSAGTLAALGADKFTLHY